MAHRLKAQLSLELLIYIALAGISLSFALSEAAKASAGTGNEIHLFEIVQFVNSLNEALMGGNGSSFRAFVPQGLCISNITGNLLSTQYGSFYLTEPLHDPNKALCPDGTYASFSIFYGLEGANLERNG
ncbi:MAG: hypothetical protein ABSD68_02755 [Candidatus Micrarchaeales archaeon]|jgi:hypothetical protein